MWDWFVTYTLLVSLSSKQLLRDNVKVAVSVSLPLSGATLIQNTGVRMNLFVLQLVNPRPQLFVLMLQMLLLDSDGLD